MSWGNRAELDRAMWKSIAIALSIVVALLLLTGCASSPRYIPVPCVTKDQVLPSKPGKIHDKLNGQADHDIKPIAGRLIRVEAWGDGLLGILEGCRR